MSPNELNKNDYIQYLFFYYFSINEFERKIIDNKYNGLV